MFILQKMKIETSNNLRTKESLEYVRFISLETGFVDLIGSTLTMLWICSYTFAG